MKYHKIPEETIRRLPLYLRELGLLMNQGRSNIRSGEFAGGLGVNPPQIRKDLSYFGGFGTPGVGYDVKKLFRRLRDILKLNDIHKTALVGAGDFGSALLGYSGFSQFGFEIVAAFDANPKKIGQMKNSVKVEHISKLNTLKQRGIRLAIIAVPANAAQEIADKLVEAGVVGILNLAPSYLTVPKKVKVVSVDIAMDLARLSYYMPASAG
ncbi:MAG: redox-sensing transcriptional repressor Rex [Planctomycetota bacterium]